MHVHTAAQLVNSNAFNIVQFMKIYTMHSTVIKHKQLELTDRRTADVKLAERERKQLEWNINFTEHSQLHVDGRQLSGTIAMTAKYTISVHH